MPLAQFQVEQLAGNRWVAEVEAGGLSRTGPKFRRVRLNADSFDEIMEQIGETYRAATAEPKPKPEASEPEPEPVDEEEDATEDGESGDDAAPAPRRRRGRPRRAAE